MNDPLKSEAPSAAKRDERGRLLPGHHMGRPKGAIQISEAITVTAHNEGQLQTKTWPELAKWHRDSINAHWFIYTATSLYSSEPEACEELASRCAGGDEEN